MEVSPSGKIAKEQVINPRYGWPGKKKEGHISIINYSFGKIRDGFTFY